MASNYTTADLYAYADRQIDYLVVNTGEAPPVGAPEVSLDLFTGTAVAGVRKLAQRWLLEFLTPLGSMSKMRFRGTRFMIDALAGKYRSGLSVTHSFAEANMLIQKNLQEEEDDTMPDDERFGSAVLENFYTIPSSDVTKKSGTTAIYLYLKVNVTSLAGTSAPALIPIPILPKALS